LVFFCTSPFVIYFIGLRFIGVTPVVSVLLIGVTISTVYKVLGTSLISRGYAIQVAMGTWIGAVVMLSVDLILLPRMGLIGAGIAASIGYAFNAAIVARAYLRTAPPLEANHKVTYTEKS
jgi:O-antigen/teichoic acid export membrane protein